MVDLSLLQSVSYIAGALGVCVAVVFYVLNLRISQRNQQLTLETRQTQLLTNIFSALNTKEIHKSYHTIDWLISKDVNETAKRMRDDKEFYADVAFIFRYFNSIGYLVKAGLLDPEKVYEVLHEPAIYLWKALGDYIIGTRRYSPDFLLNVDYLAGEMERIKKERHPGFVPEDFSKIFKI